MTAKRLEVHSIPIPPRLTGILKRVLGKWGKPWQAQFPWVTQYGLRKAIANLKKLGLIQTAQHWISQYRRVMFYRIDYEQLNALTGVVCEQFTRRDVEGDRIDVMTDHTSDPENTSDTSFLEQQTGGVLKKEVGIKNVCELPDPEPSPVEGRHESGARGINPSSSGNTSPEIPTLFPELLAEVAQAVGLLENAPLPRSLRRAIAQYPERVRGAIAYLQHQQQRRQIQNPVGYLYEAIVSEWYLAVPQATLAVSTKQHVPAGFNEWFNRARAQGLVLAAMAIDGIHHTLHYERGWVPTIQLMQEETWEVR